ncbi:helix-turn-helix domain-containing protein [Streptomonospora sp. PA3]|uniref:helix-turn-helix domain-containing protein n=1 Tax=Streptomonospora sp. PA3 TaxID=2607326 RepID=UPI001CA3BED5|nr:helix-turn-helix domain-containing protein [Streptomonospora sp. PA3]
MAARRQSLRKKQQELVRRLRQQGRTWPEVARHIQSDYRVNPRVAMRLAHGWSQRQVAEQWNQRWPAEPKTDKQVSYWEQWPAATGHAPSVDVLARLSELYQCAVADLVADIGDHRDADTAHRARVDSDELAALAASDSRHQRLAELAEHTQRMDVTDIARTAREWSLRLGAEVDLRSFFLKVSAGLSLAASLPEDESAIPEAPTPGIPDYTGIWHSRYLYYSNKREAEFAGEHYIVLRQTGTSLRGQSLPHTTGSRLELDLTIDGAVVGGHWSERTSPSGYYRGALYQGTLQMLISPMRSDMAGKWVGFGKNFRINTGEWEIVWVDHASSARKVREYHLRV